MSQKIHTSCYCPIPKRLELPKNGFAYIHGSLLFFRETKKPIVSQPLKAQPSPRPPAFACRPDNPRRINATIYVVVLRLDDFTPVRPHAHTPDSPTCAIPSKRYHGQEKKDKEKASAPVFGLPSSPPRHPSLPARRLIRPPRCDSRGSRSICGKNAC